MDELMTPPVVASLLGVSPPTVYAALRRDGDGLEHLRTPGGQIRIRRRDVLAYCHRTGAPVPAGLLRSPAAFVVHPDRRAGGRLVRLLEGVSRSVLYSEPVDALVHVGRERPAMVLLSHQLDRGLRQRVRSALLEGLEPGYTCVLDLVPGKAIPWSRGPLPRPFEVGESAGRSLSLLVAALLGTG